MSLARQLVENGGVPISGIMMFRSFVLAAVLALAAPAVHAECTDSPREGVNWRRCLFDGSDLKNAPLAGAMLRDAAFTRAMLDGADLSGADAYRAKFFSATARHAKLTGARLIEADLSRADFSGAVLRDADLRNAKLVQTVLKGADLTGAKLHGADLRDADLSGARWVDGERVCGENSIGQCN
jgi:uncharacterized protein YjbI with pentapeptide repeats